MSAPVVYISGGTGLVGSRLRKTLTANGYQVVIMSRSAPDTLHSIGAADFIIHLAGENISGKRWSARQKQRIVESRVGTANQIYDALLAGGQPPRLKTFISASATGYYGTVTTDRVFEEDDPPSNDFLGDTCRQWEAAADRFEALGVRTVKVRTGVVLTPTGGALAKMSIPVKLGIGSAFGSGRQYLPWIHIEDLCRIYLQAVEDATMRGAYNAVAPDHRTNREFTRTLARVLNRPFWFPPVPAAAMKLLLGEMSEMLLTGSRVSSEKIRRTGFQFLFPELEEALADNLIAARQNVD